MSAVWNSFYFYPEMTGKTKPSKALTAQFIFNVHLKRWRREKKTNEKQQQREEIQKKRRKKNNETELFGDVISIKIVSFRRQRTC